MATSTSLKLWSNSRIVPSRNLKIDDIDLYLTNNTTSANNLEFTNIMFMKEIQLLEFDKVIVADQLTLIDASQYSWDYATITITDNGTTKFKGYYFITKKTWSSTNSIKLHFILDTINTYECATTLPSTNVRNKYTITNKSKVLREHKDRFLKISDSVRVDYPRVFAIADSAAPYNTAYYRVSFHFDKSTNPNVTPDVITKFFVYCNIIDGGGHTIQANVSLQSYTIQLVSETETTYSYLVYFIIPYMYLSYYWGLSNINYFTAKTETPIPSLLQRVIDLQSEGVLPILYKEELGELTQPIDMSWYLYYKTEHELSQEDSNAVECLLIPENELNIKFDTSMPVKSGSSFPNFQNNTDLYFVFNDFAEGTDRGAPATYPDHVKISFHDSGDDIILENDLKILSMTNYNNMTLRQVVIRLQVNSSDATKLNLYLYNYEYKYVNGELTNSGKTLVSTYNAIASIEFLNVSTSGTSISAFLSNDAELTATELLEAQPSYSITFTSSTEVSVYSLDQYDRTLSTLIKIIKLPYCPVNYSYNYDNEELIMDSMFQFDTEKLVLTDINSKFSATIQTEIDNPIASALNISHQITIGESRDNDFESKLFHSDYHQIKFVYDSFSYTFPLEKIYINASIFTDKFRFKFVMTSTMNSKFAFMFDDIVYKYATEDYPNVVCVARNNEEVIYNSTYLNYLRTAYNYDLKAKERTEMASTIGTALTIVGSVASVGLAIASENPALIVSSIIGATASITTSVINNVNTIAQQEANQESKLKQLQAQSVSVAGSDDVDIMSAYCNNRAKLCLYKVSERMKNALADLFFYTGYATNEMKIPSFNSRYYFNFIAMIPDIINVCNLSEEIIEDLKTRWSNGVTIIHKRSNAWNMAQDKENWEVSLL